MVTRPLRWTVAGIVWLCASLAALAGGIFGASVAAEIAYTEGQRESLVRIALFEASLDAAMRDGATGAVAEVVTNIAADRNVRRAFIVNDAGVVIASTRLGEVGSQASSSLLSSSTAASLLPRARASLTPAVGVDRAARRVWAAVGLDASGPSHAALLIEHDVGGAFARITRNSLVALGLFLIVSAVTALGAGLLFDLMVARRSRRLLTAASEVARGNFDARTGVAGADEFGVIGVAFDDMAAHLEADRVRARATELRYRAIFEAATEAIFVGADDGTLDDANAAAVALLGYSAAELRGMSPKALLAPEDKAEHEFDAIRAGHVNRGETSGAVVRLAAPERLMLSKSGERIPGAIAARVLPGGRMLVMVRDLRPTREAARLRETLIVQERLAALGTLAASVGHEINNPLTYLVGNLQLIDERLASLPAATRQELATLLRDAVDGAERVRRIVAELNVFARAPRADDALDTVDLRRVVAAAVHLAAPAVRAVARIEEDIADVGRVKGDERRLTQVVLNLLNNAAQAMPRDRPDVDNVICVVGRADGGVVTLDVIDNGSGITPDVLPRVFEPFFTTKPAGVGSGLGLSISRELLAHFGANIDVDSRVSGPERGTRFRITLEAAPPTAPSTTVSRTATPPPQPTSSRRSVLVVDDEPMLQRVLVRRLSAHDVVAVGGVTDALAACGSGKFDCILCDLTMPDGGGEALYRRLEREHPALAERVVFMTGGAITAESSQFLETSGRPVLDKPIDAKRLHALVLDPTGA